MKRIFLLMTGVLMMASISCGKPASANQAADGQVGNVKTEVANEARSAEGAGKIEHKAVLKTVDQSLGGVEAFKQIMDSYAGKVVVLDFWATWCPPCRKAMVEVDKVKPALMDKGVCFVYITGETSPQKDFDKMMPNIHGDHYRLTNAQWGEICNSLNIPGIPAYAVVGKDGSMEYNNLSRGGFPGNETIVNAAETALMK
jgi:thiol-disulfide isomerase/thioredoxin